MTPEQMAELHSRCFTSPRPWSAGEFATFLHTDRVFFCTVQQGFAVGRVAGPEAELLTIAVAPEARGLGFGRNLLNQYHQAARGLGATESFLEVAADNAAAHGLYQSAGYKKVGERSGYYRTAAGIRLDALVFSRDLSRPQPCFPQHS